MFDKRKNAAKLAALCFLTMKKFRSNTSIFGYIQKEVALIIAKMIYSSHNDKIWDNAVTTLRNESFLKNNCNSNKNQMIFPLSRLVWYIYTADRCYNSRDSGTRINQYNDNYKKKIPKKQFYVSKIKQKNIKWTNNFLSNRRF